MTIDPVSLAITAALTAAQMGLQATQKIEGPRLDDLSVTVADYGTPLNYFYGTRRFEGVPIIWAEPLREVKKKRKTKGGKYNEYTYYATWAIAIANHQIDGVTRIWFDKHLVYDATGAGPISPFALGKKAGTITDYMRIYLGTEDQMPDPRMLAAVERDHGAGSCPAYRGTALIVFDDLPVEKFGNRIPQITVEAVAHGAPSYPWESHPYTVGKPGNVSFSPDGAYMMWGNADYEIWDTVTRTMVMSGTFPVQPSYWPWFGVSNNGSIFATSGAGSTLGGTHIIIYSPFGANLSNTLSTGTNYQRGCVVLEDGNGTEHVFTYPASSWPYFSGFALGGLGVTTYDPIDFDGVNRWQPRHFFTDSHGDIWVVGSFASVFVTSDMFMARIVDTGARPGSPGFMHFTGLPALSSYGTSVYGAHYDGHFILQWAGQWLYKIDEDTLSIVDSRNFGSEYSANNWRSHVPGTPTLWLETHEISLSDLSTVRSVDLNDWLVEDATFGTLFYEPVTNALVGSPQFESHITWRFLDRIGSDGLTLGAIADDIAERCGVPAGNADFASLDQVIHGYNWTQGAGRDILEPLFDAYDSDIVPHDFAVRGKKRGAASGGTIDVAEFVKAEPRYKDSIVQDPNLPRVLTFSFADLAAEQQTNSVLAQRPVGAVDGVRELSINFTSLALGADEARQLAERYLRRKWFGRDRIENAVTAQQLLLEPGDVRTFGLDGLNRKARLIEQTISTDGSIKCLWERDDASIAVLSGASGASMDGRAPSVMLVPGPARGFVLDVPLAQDADDQASPFMMIAAGSYSSTAYWPGADFYWSDDGADDSYEAGWASIGALDACTWGYANEALGDALPWLPDNGNSLNINLRAGELESVTDAEFDASATINLALVQNDSGWEYVRFRSATLEGDGSWTISGLARGLRGTEQWVTGHATGNLFLLVDASLAKKAMSASEIGDTDYYKAVSQGREESSAYPDAVTFTAAAQKPYSPVHGELTRDSGSGDWSIDAVRRTRIGGGNIDGGDVPLGETSESWSCDIMDGADVVRTITGGSLPLSYSSAQQTTDFGAPQTSLTVNLYQVSPALSLRGYGLAIVA